MNIVRPRPRPERGAALVEGALVFSLLFLLIMATFEFGLVFRAHLITGNAARSGARTLAASANASSADRSTIEKVHDSLQGIPRSALVSVVIFNPATADELLTGTRLSRCLTASVAGLCNHYSPADLEAGAERFGCGPGALDRSWCPTTRKVTRTGGLAMVGVFVRTRHSSATGMLGSSRIIDRQVVMQMEASLA